MSALEADQTLWKTNVSEAADCTSIEHIQQVVIPDSWEVSLHHAARESYRNVRIPDPIPQNFPCTEHYSSSFYSFTCVQCHPHPRIIGIMISVSYHSFDRFEMR